MNKKKTYFLEAHPRPERPHPGPERAQFVLLRAPKGLKGPTPGLNGSLKGRKAF